MGRYYSLNNGMGGKFGFGVQSSNDAEIFGMQEEDPTYVSYYLDDSEENRESVRKILDEQYDILQFPKSERIYTIKEEKELNSLYDKFDLLVYEAVPLSKGAKLKIGYAGDGTWWKKFAPKDFEGTEAEFYNKYKIIPRRDIENPVLAECRIAMGIKILSCLESQGYCEMEAEL